MRYVPVAIHRITVKAAAKVIMHAAASHLAESEKKHLQCTSSRGIGILPMLLLRFRNHRPETDSNLPRVTKSAFYWIKRSLQLLISGVEDFSFDTLTGIRLSRLRLAQRFDDSF